MKQSQRPLMFVLRYVVAAMLAVLLGWASAPADTAPEAPTVLAAVQGVVRGPPEGVVFSGQASIGGKVIDDGVFGAPAVLEIPVDLSDLSGVGLSSGEKYRVADQATLQRPVLAFDSMLLTFPFFADGDMLSARSTQAFFSIYFSAAKGMTTSRVVITDKPPG